jgi:hypothetical protein
MFMLMPTAMPSAIPSSELCASESPKYAMRFHTIKQPRAPVKAAIPIPAIIALIIKGSKNIINSILY